ncbi:MAG: HYR domain-containing protein [Saprospiraceae bacterium]|nr:HYR domain-containing protein [Saprospiraceae bacterium]
MLQKPILWLTMVVLTFVGLGLAVPDSLTTLFHSNEGTYPKSNPLAIACPDGFIRYVDEDCLIDIKIKTPTSNCTITSMNYSVAGGPPILLSGPDYPDSIDIGAYGPGTFNVVFIVVDDCVPPANATCTLTIILLDTISPVLICPANVIAGNNPDDGRNALIDVGQPTANDNCGIASIINNYNFSDDASDQYPLGTTIVIWTATDVNNNTSTCAMTVTVLDNTPPVLTCPDTLRVDCDIPVPYQDFIEFMMVGGSAVDETALDTLSFAWVNDTSSMTCPDTIARTYMISDTTGNTGFCTQIIIVTDSINPTALCRDTTIYLPSTGQVQLMASQLDNGSFDDCQYPLQFTAPFTLLFGCNDHSNIPINVTITVSDICNNSATCTALVTVLDTIKPTIICPVGITVSNTNGICGATGVNLGTSVSSDNCILMPPSANFNGQPVNLNTIFPIGLNEVIWSVSDFNGNTGTCIQYVVVMDNELPLISCPANIAVNTQPNLCTAIVNYVTPVGTDNCPGAITTQTSGLASGSVFPIGITTNTFLVTAANGATASCLFTVTVTDNQPPVINCPSNMAVNTSLNQCNAVVNYNAPVGTDNCPGANTIRTTGLPSGATYPLGVTTNTFVVTSSNNATTSCSFTVTVTDNQPPVIVCPSNIAVNTSAGNCNAIVNYVTPVGTDNCPGAVTIRTTGLASGATFPVGVTTNTFVVTAANSVTASCSFTVTVTDNQSPIISCPPNISPSVSICNITDVPVLDITNFVTGGGTITDNCNMLMLSAIDVPDGMTCPQTIARNYTVTDLSNNSAGCTQFIVINDLTKPNITTPQNISANNDNNLCNANVTVPALSVTDNCGIQSIINDRNGTSNASGIYPVGEHDVLWTVTDFCNNTSTIFQTITISDTQAPNFECSGLKKISVSEYPELPAAHFVIPGTVDNCGGEITYAARRMNVSCGVQGSNVFGPYVPFCCADVSDTIMVEVRVTDQYGNSNTCMVLVVVEDKIPPAITAGLPDITISCEYPLDLNNLNAFGTFVRNEADRADIILNDPGHPYYPPSGFAGKDGLYTDNCPDVTINVSLRNLLTMCNTGELKRDFVLTDMSGNQITFTQTIYVKDVQPFQQSDIQWPQQEVFYNFCNIAIPDQNVTGKPNWLLQKCSQVASEFSDLTFQHPVHCRYVRRTWTVIDWCQYKTNTPNSPGKWTYIQHIYVTNNVAPVISNTTCKDTIVCAQGAACNASVIFNAAGTDDCLPQNISWSYKVDINNNNSVDVTGNGASLNRIFERGTHKMTWEAKDQCGNSSTCSFLFTVKDCKAPVPIALKGLAINLINPGPKALIWASDFNNFSSDNCTPAGQLKFSFSSNINDTGKTFTCEDLGKQDVEFWVTDLDGNQSKTTTFITVQDNHGLCGILPKVSIKGEIRTEDNLMLPETKVTIDGGETDGTKMTDVKGVYDFKELAMYNNYELSPVRDTLPLQGVSTLDLVIIQRHILGIEPILSPYKIIAADVNNSKSVTAADLVELRKMILGLNTSFSNNTSWRFIDASQEFQDILYPWPLREVIQYENVDTDMEHSDFIAVKTGDVNSSISGILSENYSEQRSFRKVELSVEDVYLKEGDLMSIPFQAKDFQDILGLQWTMEVSKNLEYSGFEAVDLELKAENIAYIQKDNRNYITGSFYNIDGITLDEEKILFNLIFMVKKSERLSKSLFLKNNITTSEVYDIEMNTIGLSLGYRAESGSEKNIVMQNNPNPFKEETTINLQLSKRKSVSITIFDSEGKLVYKNTEEMPAGSQRITISEKQLGNRMGVFYCKIKAEDLNEVIRILRLE